MKTLQRTLMWVGAILIGAIVLRMVVRQARRGAWCKEGLGGCNKKSCTKCRKTKSEKKCKKKCSGCDKQGNSKNSPKYTQVKLKGSKSGGGGGGTCTVSHYTADPAENDGYDRTHDGTKLKKALGMKTVAVPSDAYSANKHRTVTIEGKTYTVRDSCKSCAGLGRDFDILVKDKATASRLGVKQVPCSWKP